jgi:hypothetical protein
VEHAISRLKVVAALTKCLLGPRAFEFFRSIARGVWEGRVCIHSLFCFESSRRSRMRRKLTAHPVLPMRSVHNRNSCSELLSGRQRIALSRQLDNLFVTWLLVCASVWRCLRIQKTFSAEGR